MLRYHFCISYLILVILLPLSTLAQVSPYKNYTVADGLLSNKVFAICQDSTGYMYFATDRGISVFNGHSFKNFTVKEGMPTNIYYGLYKDKWNRVWAQSTSDQIISFKNGNIYQIESLKSVFRQIEIHEGLNGIYLRNTNGETYVEKENSLSKKEYGKIAASNASDYRIILNEDHFLDIGKQVVTVYNYLHNKQYTISNNNQNYIIKHLKNANFYKLGKYLTIVILNEHKIRFINIYNQSDTKEINFDKLLNTKNAPYYLPQIILGKLSIENKSGLIQIDSFINIKTLKYEDRIHINSITRSYIDDQGNFWCGTENDGIFFVPNKIININNFKIDAEEFGRPCIIEGDSNNVFIGTNNGSIFQLISNKLKLRYKGNNGKINSINILDNLVIFSNNKEFFSIPIDHQNEIQFNQKENKIINSLNYLKNIAYKKGGIKKIKVFEKEDLIFVAFVNDCIFWNINSGEIYKTDYFKNKIIENIYKHRPEDFEIFLYNTNEIFIFNTKDLLIKSLEINDSIRTTISIYSNSQNELYVSSTAKGLWKLKNNIFNQKYKFDGHFINQFRIFSDDTKVVSTSKGVTIIDKNDNIIHSLAFQDGLLENNSIDSYLFLDQVVTISEKGISTFPLIDEIQIFNKKPHIILNKGSHNLNPRVGLNNRNINLCIESFDYQSLGESKFHYMLDGFDEEWKITKNTEINYALTKPGTYTFRCKLENYKGQISPNESTMQIILLPRWYETLFFRILGIIILVSMLTGSIQFVLKRKKKTEKARLMADIQISDVKLESLRAQMNPHFVFNAMGSIQNLIQNDQKDLADTYLSRFSRLLRLYLESSKNEDILLKDEIQLITKYLEIEKLRFKDRLDFKIMVQPSELDTSTVKIPSLLLQPIIENALGHGLFHKEGGGLISILIEEKAEGLKIIIEDDGIGRAKAAQMKTQTSNSHISRGLEMMKDRISLVNKKGNYRVTLEYHDLIKDSIPLGTRVILNIK